MVEFWEIRIKFRLWRVLNRNPERQCGCGDEPSYTRRRDDGMFRYSSRGLLLRDVSPRAVNPPCQSRDQETTAQQADGSGLWDGVARN